MKYFNLGKEIYFDHQYNKVAEAENKQFAEKMVNELNSAARIAELEAENKDLHKRLYALQGVATIRKCKSCDGYYVDGYVCSCGRDNSYSNQEWAEVTK